LTTDGTDFTDTVIEIEHFVHVSVLSVKSVVGFATTCQLVLSVCRIGVFRFREIEENGELTLRRLAMILSPK
jgi:hypothetical protein